MPTRLLSTCNMYVRTCWCGAMAHYMVRMPCKYKKLMRTQAGGWAEMCPRRCPHASTRYDNDHAPLTLMGHGAQALAHMRLVPWMSVAGVCLMAHPLSQCTVHYAHSAPAHTHPAAMPWVQGLLSTREVDLVCASARVRCEAACVSACAAKCSHCQQRISCTTYSSARCVNMACRWAHSCAADTSSLHC